MESLHQFFQVKEDQSNQRAKWSEDAEESVQCGTIGKELRGCAADFVRGGGTSGRELGLVLSGVAGGSR